MYVAKFTRLYENRKKIYKKITSNNTYYYTDDSKQTNRRQTIFISLAKHHHCGASLRAATFTKNFTLNLAGCVGQQRDRVKTMYKSIMNMFYLEGFIYLWMFASLLTGKLEFPFISIYIVLYLCDISL